MRKKKVTTIFISKGIRKGNYLQKEIIYTKSPTSKKYWTALSTMFFDPSSHQH